MSRDYRIYDTTARALRPRPVHSWSAFGAGLIAGTFVGFIVCIALVSAAFAP